MLCFKGVLYDENGIVPEEDAIQKEIYELVKTHVATGLANKCRKLLEAIRLACRTEELPIQTDRIHVENGTLYLDGRFEPVREICRNRLTVRYDPAAPLCSHWLDFLIQLLEPEDIPVLQEYLGYYVSQVSPLLREGWKSGLGSPLWLHGQAGFLTKQGRIFPKGHHNGAKISPDAAKWPVWHQFGAKLVRFRHQK